MQVQDSLWSQRGEQFMPRNLMEKQQSSVDYKTSAILHRLTTPQNKTRNEF